MTFGSLGTGVSSYPKPGLEGSSRLQETHEDDAGDTKTTM
jgi:hypothetical protein